jgi:predicted DNA-binding transcriptional regulator YafY
VSVATLAADTSCSERTVRRDIRALVGMGVVSRLGPDEFVIHCDVLEGMQRVGDA